MGHRTGFIALLQSGAGGYVGHSSEADARSHASRLGGSGWVFRFDYEGFQGGRHRRSRPVVKLWQVSVFGSPAENSLEAALKSAGARHCVSYVLASD